MNIADNVLCLAKDRGMTQKSLADVLGISTGNISDWKSGRSKPSTDIIVKVSEYFNVSTDYLLTGKERNNNDGTSVHTGNISNSAIGVNNHAPVTIKNGHERELTEQEIEMLKIYNNLSAKEKAQLFLEVCKFDKT